MSSVPLGIWDLPDEVLIYIFTKLDEEFVIRYVMNVCPRWQSIVTGNTVFWKNIQVVIDCDMFTNCSYLKEPDYVYTPINKPWSEYKKIFIGEKDVDKLLKVLNFKFIEGSSVLNKSVSLLLEILDTINGVCKNIQKIEFHNCIGATSSDVMRFLTKRYNHSVTEVKFGMNKTILNRFPCDKVSNFDNLKTLVVHDKMFRSGYLFQLSEGCEHLDSLWILLCQHLEPEDILYFLDKKKHILKELGVGTRLNDCILNKLEECHSLEVLFATDASCISDDCFKSFAAQTSLKYCSLHLAKFQLTTITVIAKLSGEREVFKLLEVLDLTGYSNYSSEELWQSWPTSPHKFKTRIMFIFSNSVERAIDSNKFDFWRAKTNRPLHWMYSNCIGSMNCDWGMDNDVW